MRTSLYFGGSRMLSPGARDAAMLLGWKLARLETEATVGCQTGADAAMAQGFGAVRGFALTIHCAGSSPAWAVDPLTWCAVRPFSGSAPHAPMPARLARRTSAAIAQAAAATAAHRRPRGFAVFVLQSAASQGSLTAAQKAAASGLRVLVYTAGAWSPPAIGTGRWHRGGQLHGLTAWSWQQQPNTACLRR